MAATGRVMVVTAWPGDPVRARPVSTRLRYRRDTAGALDAGLTRGGRVGEAVSTFATVADESRGG